MSIYDFAQDVRGDRRRRRVLVDEDFSWSEVPRKRSSASPVQRSGGSEDLRYPYSAEVESFHDEPVYAIDGFDDRYEADLAETHDLSRAERHDLIEEAYGAMVPASEGRRTVVITGHGAERHLVHRPRREAGLRPYERSGFKPDRIALWAFLLALALLLGATTSSHAAVLAQHIAR